MVVGRRSGCKLIAGLGAVLPAMMPDVEDGEVVVAHTELVTLRLGDVFLKVDADQWLTEGCPIRSRVMTHSRDVIHRSSM
jgi:hypothetical protein